MKKIFILATAVLALAACKKEQEVVLEPPVADQSIGFDAYTLRGTQTRAGYAGDIRDAELQDAAKADGFGVFAYYTDNNDYDQMAMPNFMYNQHVTYSGGTWLYTPVKYWPNEYGTNAISDDSDRVSFFAYAPYVEVAPSSGKPVGDGVDTKTGITQLSRNTATGDPIVKYVASFDAAKAVDLLWGVNEQNTWTLVNSGAQQKFTFGMPWLDVQRPSEARTQADAQQRVKFTFKHALAKMQVNIDAFVDGLDNTNALETETKIFVRSIRFNGFAMKGALNLNNEIAYKPYWLNYNGVGDLEAEGDIVVYDGRRDGKEGMENATASNEKSLGLRQTLIQKEGMIDNAGTATAAWNATAVGVTNSTVTLFDNGGIFYVIPVSGESVEVEIVYDVETIDKNLASTVSDGKTPGSTIENHITKKIQFGSDSSLEAGKAYTINLHLGMNSVKFDAAVVDWDAIVPGSDIDLPANMPVFAAGASGAKAPVSIPGYEGTAEEYDYYFAVSGFDGGEAIVKTAGTILTSPVVNSKSDFNPAAGDNKSNQSGVAYVWAKAQPYTKVVNQTGTDDIKLVSNSGKELTLTVAQLAVKLGLTAPESLTASASLALRRTYGSSAEAWSDGATGCPALAGYPGTDGNNYIRVWRNGAELVYATTTTGNEFSFDPATGKITLVTAPVAGDVIKVTIKCGDVAEETITFTLS